jgi:hypothetical protein
MELQSGNLKDPPDDMPAQPGLAETVFERAVFVRTGQPQEGSPRTWLRRMSTVGWILVCRFPARDSR